jgi:nitrogen fixation protein FixH
MPRSPTTTTTWRWRPAAARPRSIPARARSDGRLLPEVAGSNLRRLIRPRTFVYLAIWGLIGVALLFALATRDLLEINVQHDRNPQFVLLSDGSIRNGYTVKLLNKVAEPRAVTLSLEGLEGATMHIGGVDMPEAREMFVMLEPDRLRNLRVFVRLPPDRVPGASRFHLQRRGATRGRIRQLFRHLPCTGDQTMNNMSDRPREFTGKHLLPDPDRLLRRHHLRQRDDGDIGQQELDGLVVQNSYVESQKFNDHFDAARRAPALGWRSEMSYADGPSPTAHQWRRTGVRLMDVAVEFRRPVQEAKDQNSALLPAGDGVRSPGSCRWMTASGSSTSARLHMVSSEPWRDMKRIFVRNGTLQ